MFIWSKEYELGISSIDEQHQEFFRIGNRIEEVLFKTVEEEEDYEKVLAIIDELREYTVYHFKTEEELILRYDYADYEAHKREHEKLIEFVNALNFKETGVLNRASLRNLLAEVIQWVFKHIITTDFLYKDYLLSLVSK